MTSSLEDEIQRIVASMENEDQTSQEREPQETTEQEQQPEETIHIHYFPDAIVILKEDGDIAQQSDTIETTLVAPKKPPFFIAYAICSFYLFLILSCIAFQVYVLLNPPIATVTIIPKSQTVTLTGTLQLGRFLQPITISQSQTVPATGKGHQDRRSARGFITVYNGLFTSQSVQAGTILTGADGVQIIIDQDAVIPAANPPSLGYATVSAHALYPGLSGNIPSLDINQACCATAIKAVNTTSFTGGQDERNFQTVRTSDIASDASPLKTAVMQSMRGALQGQAQPPEQLYMLPCTPTVTSDHQPGEEAIQAHVTVSETCSAVAYDKDALQAQATALLSQQAVSKLGTWYSLVGEVHVTVKQATVTPHHTPVVFSFNALGTWVYAVKSVEQQRIKSLIAGKTKQEAEQLLASMPGIEQASIRWGDDTKLPKHTESIRVVVMYGI
jgi:hypothetical protein